MMRWLTGWMDKEGPGVEKDAPEKTGIALFGQIVTREAWELFKLNLLIVLASLPLVTAPAAHAAATRIAALMVCDENIYLWRDFWAAFRALFLRATPAGMLVLTVLCGGAYAMFIWFQLAVHMPLAVLPLVVSAAVTLFMIMVAVNLFVLIATSDLSFTTMLKEALVATLARPLPVLGAVAFMAALWLAHILFYPMSVFMPAVMNFSLGVLALTFATLPTSRRRQERSALQS